jgi:hypothetical protein
MLTTYLNTNEYVFLDADGNSFPDGSPALSVGGKEEVHIFLKSATPDWGTAAARPAEWAIDTSWASIPGISAMLTVDDDYRKYLAGTLENDATAGEMDIVVRVSETDEIPESGLLKILHGTGKEEYLFFEGRLTNGSLTTFALSNALAAPIAKGTTVQVQQEPYAQAFIVPEKSNWSKGELFFTLVSDSLRLRREVENSNSATVNITGIELLLYSTSADNTVQIHKAFLLDTATLKNVQGNPGFPAAIPDKFEDEIAKNVAEKVEALKEEVVPAIGTSGNWVIDGIETGVKAQGPKGDPMKIDATGTVSELSQYDTELKGFAFLATDTGMVYIKASDTSGDWSAPVGFQAPAGKDGYTPVRGTDYWTEEDIAEIKAYVDEAILNGAW